MTSEQKTTVNVVFGAMTFGKPGAEQSRVHDINIARDILDVFQKHGHNEVDTARAYGVGSSEEMLGELEWQKRNIVMDTKYFPTANFAQSAAMGWSTDGHLDEKNLRENIEKSLKALKTDQVDLFYLHAPDRTVPVETTLKVVNDFYKEGKFKRLGVSNYMSWEVAQMSEICKQNGWKQIDVYQGVYNALHRAVELELLPCLRKYGISFYNFNPLAGGYLTDRYHREDSEIESGSRFDPNKWQGKMYRGRYWNSQYFDALDILRPVAKKHGLTEAECALRWMTHHSQLKRENGDAIIIGASSVKHIEQNLIDLEKPSLPDEVVEALNRGWEGCKAISQKYFH